MVADGAGDLGDSIRPILARRSATSRAFGLRSLLSRPTERRPYFEPLFSAGALIGVVGVVGAKYSSMDVPIWASWAAAQGGVRADILCRPPVAASKFACDAPTRCGKLARWLTRRCQSCSSRLESLTHGRKGVVDEAVGFVDGCSPGGDGRAGFRTARFGRRRGR